MVENDIVASIKDTDKIAILPHVSIDGDALGSSLALALALKKQNRNPVIYLEEEIPSNFSFLPGKEFIRIYDGNSADFDLVMALDTGDRERLGRRIEIFNKAGLTINMDHHPTNTEFANLNLVKTGASATGEMIYQVIKMMGLEFDKDIAVCLYVAIVTDTGGFRFSNTTTLTHQITADLLNYELDVAHISQILFETSSLSKVKLMGMAIDNLEVLEDGKVAFMTITDDMIKSAGAKDEECDGLVNIGRNVGDVEVAVLMRQKTNGEFKINFRSKNYVDVSEIANKLSGGGHKRAAGCTIKGSMKEIKELILKEIKQVL
ncbi:MAG: bifunctional oligoribonuclease/PAP phosphatase NrnA [Clostridiaceae bacterium]|nr:bifunctional oligoribonuclease/PAP phosphatase NrnA [Clostridiaceae bacterium]